MSRKQWTAKEKLASLIDEHLDKCIRTSEAIKQAVNL